MRSLVFSLTIICYVVLSKQKKNTKDSNRIVGGGEIPITRAPYQVALLMNNVHMCGGVIIAPKIVLSAAHCRFDVSMDLYKIRAGSASRSQGGEVRQVVEIRAHENYNATTFDYDISIVKLKRNLEFTDKISSIEMKNEGDTVPDGDMLFVSGWGRLENNGQKPDKLHGVSVEKVPAEDCKRFYKRMNVITPRMICAGRGIKDACVGDSGGPAVHDDQLAGIVSFGKYCAGPQPGVYVKVAVVRKWINKNMKELLEGRKSELPLLKRGTRS